MLHIFYAIHMQKVVNSVQGHVGYTRDGDSAFRSPPIAGLFLRLKNYTKKLTVGAFMIPQILSEFFLFD